jgi:hypothetical protein
MDQATLPTCATLWMPDPRDLPALLVTRCVDQRDQDLVGRLAVTPPSGFIHITAGALLAELARQGLPNGHREREVAARAIAGRRTAGRPPGPDLVDLWRTRDGGTSATAVALRLTADGVDRIAAATRPPWLLGLLHACLVFPEEPTQLVIAAAAHAQPRELRETIEHHHHQALADRLLDGLQQLTLDLQPLALAWGALALRQDHRSGLRISY